MCDVKLTKTAAKTEILVAKNHQESIQYKETLFK